MSFAMRCRAAVALTVIAVGSACGGDSTGPGAGGPPQPPAGSATQVPRVLGLSTIDGKQVPTMHYTSPAYKADAWTDSGSATLQADSMLVLRTYTRWVDHGAGSQAPGTADMFTTAGRLLGTGIAILPYTDGTADTAHVLANGAIEAQLSIEENGTPKPYGTFLFSAPYSGSTLNPVPYVRSIQPVSLPQFADSAVVTLTGTSFLPTTQLWWDQQTQLSVTYVGQYELTTVVRSNNLLTAGKHTLTVRNPGPGGGDRIFAFQVTVPEPMIISISPTTMIAAGGDFILNVHGKGFVQGTRVLWNGAPHSATVLSATDLWSTISSSDIPAAGTYQVAVQTPAPTAPLTGGGTSGVISFTVTGTSAQKYSEVATPFGANALIADPTRSLVYGVPNGFETSYPHSVVAMDPTSGNIAWTLDLGALPTAMAMAGDGSYLYAVAGDTVFRVALATHTVALKIPIPRVGNSWVAGLAVMPGQPRTVAMQYECYCGDIGLSNSIELYDDTQMRPWTAVLDGTPGPITFSSAQMLHAFANNVVSDIAVTSGGAAIAAKNVAHVGYSMLYIDGTRAFTGSGVIYDLVTHAMTQVPNMQSGWYAVALSSNAATVYSTDDSSSFVRAYTTATGAQIGAVAFTTGPATPRQGSTLTRWGQDGIAITLMTKVVFLRASFIY